MVAGVSLVALVLAAYAAGRWGALGAVALGLTSLMWLVFNGPMEGATLIVLSSAHGLTAADLVGVGGLVMAGVILLRAGGGP